MPWHTKSTIGCSGVQRVAGGALVALTCMALASCGGGPGAARPDLVVEDPSVSDDRPTAGASLTVSATVRNAGRGNAAATMLRIYRSDDETITPADEPVATATVAELAASESHDASVTLTVPPSPGTYRYHACVDPVAGESDTANNCSAAKQVIVPQAQDAEPASPRPDLVVEDSAVSNHRQTAGAGFTFSATVRNAGEGEAAASELRVYRSDDATVTTSDQEVDAVTVPVLAALESVDASAKLSAPSSPGTYYYHACVLAVAKESDTANNCSDPVQVTVHTAQVTAPAAPRPDLIVLGAWVNNASPAMGGVFELGAEVHNRSVKVPLEMTLRFYRSTDKTIERSDTHLGDRGWWMGTSEYNQEVYDYVTLQAPSSKGTYYYGACVDAVTVESDTTNNCSAAAKVEVSHNKPDLGVNSWVMVGTWSAGGTVKASSDVWNVGGPSAATTLRLIRLPTRESAPSEGTLVAEAAVPKLVVTQASKAYSSQTFAFKAPATAGWYYYVMCVDAVSGESNTANNCSTVAKLEVR
ncbi:MAG: hypothetical protein OXP69_18675 [Spirochaetaceae bacterium]|nr:hypothetical protein [Spirochaetaceae bacterium]